MVNKIMNLKNKFLKKSYYNNNISYQLITKNALSYLYSSEVIQSEMKLNQSYSMMDMNLHSHLIVPLDYKKEKKIQKLLEELENVKNKIEETLKA